MRLILNSRFLFIISIGISFFAKSGAPASTWNKEIYWDWSKIDTTQIYSFPKNFLWGGADSGMQTEGTALAGGGDCQNSWTVYQEIHNSPQNQCLHGNHRKTRYDEDAQLLGNFGFNIFRFSIVWDKVQPQENVFNTAELDWYVQFVDSLTSRGITPMLCFFHHCWPLWFDKKGAFEKADNINHFINFVRVTYAYLYKHAKHPHMLNYILTLNEPVGYALCGYLVGTLPPAIKDKTLYLPGVVIKNMLDAHAGAYDVIKKINPLTNIGLALVFAPLDPYRKNHPLDRLGSYIGKYLLHEVRERYFKTGYFSWRSFGLVNEYNPNVIGKLDFIGLNYYTHRVTKGLGAKNHPRATAKFADNSDWSIYPEGLYRSIEKAAAFGLPIIITENGIQTDNDFLKDEYLRTHLYVIHKALQDGYDIRGYMWWSPIDCFSWHKGYTKYGFIGVDLITKNRFLRPQAADYFMKTIAFNR